MCTRICLSTDRESTAVRNYTIVLVLNAMSQVARPFGIGATHNLPLVTERCRHVQSRSKNNYGRTLVLNRLLFTMSTASNRLIGSCACHLRMAGHEAASLLQTAINICAAN